jgi:hypothetical protein
MVLGEKPLDQAGKNEQNRHSPDQGHQIMGLSTQPLTERQAALAVE